MPDERPDTKGWVYFASANDKQVKIGFTRSLRQRLHDLRTASSEFLIVKGVMRGTENDEKELHERFKAYWTRGEWFRLSPEIEAFIRDNTSPAPDRRGGLHNISWDRLTMDTILSAHAELVKMGMKKPSIRACLYLLLKLPTWSKGHYNTMCSKLGEWRDAGKIPFGLFADDGAGQAWVPLTSREIAERIQALQGTLPAKLGPGGYIYVVFVEHISLVDMIADWLDYEVPIVSSQGQLRREHLYSAISQCLDVVKELGGKGLRIIGLTDYDPGGDTIYEAHRRWLKRIFKLGMERWAVTPEQVRTAHLPVREDHQLDGVIAAYGPQRFRRELRQVVGLPP